MRILALNSGSSSIKCGVIESSDGSALFNLQIKNIGARASLVDDRSEQILGVMTFQQASAFVLDAIQARLTKSYVLDAIAHRIVHGGERFVESTRVDDAVLKAIDALAELAPLHNPPALAMLCAAYERFGKLPHVAIFDTAFHSTLPPRAREYALPLAFAKEHGLRRYGFHGISYACVVDSVARHLKRKPTELRIVACHLGNGASVAAIEFGRSVETSMGMTPLEGLVMGTRCGDIDPGILLSMLRLPSFNEDKLDRMLNFESGLLGLCGTFDFSEVQRRALQGHESCRLAIEIYVHRLRKYIGSYVAVMGGVDVIAFSGGIGEHSAVIRRYAVQSMGYLGVVLDEELNDEVKLSRTQNVVDVSARDSRVRILVVLVDEQAEMAREAANLLEERSHFKAHVN